MNTNNLTSLDIKSRVVIFNEKRQLILVNMCNDDSKTHIMEISEGAAIILVNHGCIDGIGLSQPAIDAGMVGEDFQLRYPYLFEAVAVPTFTLVRTASDKVN